MEKFKGKFKGKNSDLIKTFIDAMEIRDNYEVWVPYQYRGVLGFIDLVTEENSRISLFKFLSDASDLEKAVKNLKLEKEVYPKSRGVEKNIKSYLVVEDTDSNRKSIISLDPLLKEQSFEILLLNRDENSVESYFESKYSIRQLFKSENLHLEDDGLDELIKRENHGEITRAILEIDDPPKSVDRKFIRKVASYLKRNDQIPDSVDSLEKQNERTRESYRTRPDDVSVKETEQSY